MNPDFRARRAMAVICLLAVTASASLAGELPKDRGFELEPGVRILPPVSHGQLAIYPAIQTITPAERAQYLTLEEGLKQKLVKVTEHKGGAEVNRVTVVNRSDKPLLILGGEVILGGQQDRVTQKDQLIKAKGEATVAVFCVEHGRWSGGREFTGSGGLVERKIKARAKFGASQGQVWEEVAKKASALGGQSETGTYRTLATGEAGKRAAKPFREAIVPALDALPEKDRMLGLVATVNGEVVAAELFATPELFKSYRAKLLESLFVSAADEPVVAKPKVADEKDIKGFIDDAEQRPEKPVLANDEGRTVEKEGNRSVGSTIEAKGTKTKVYRGYLMK